MISAKEAYAIAKTPVEYDQDAVLNDLRDYASSSIEEDATAGYLKTTINIVNYDVLDVVKDFMEELKANGYTVKRWNPVDFDSINTLTITWKNPKENK